MACLLTSSRELYLSTEGRKVKYSSMHRSPAASAGRHGPPSPAAGATRWHWGQQQQPLLSEARPSSRGGGLHSGGSGSDGAAAAGEHRPVSREPSKLLSFSDGRGPRKAYSARHDGRGPCTAYSAAAQITAYSGAAQMDRAPRPRDTRASSASCAPPRRSQSTFHGVDEERVVVGPLPPSEPSFEPPFSRQTQHQHRRTSQYRQYQQWREQRKIQNTAPHLKVVEPSRSSGDGANEIYGGGDVGEGGGPDEASLSQHLSSRFSLGGCPENPRPIAFADNASADLPADDTTKWHYKKHQNAGIEDPWDWWQHRVLPWVSDEARREVGCLEDFIVRCIVANGASAPASASGPASSLDEASVVDEARATATLVLRHAAHELFRRVPVLRLGTARALEAAQKRSSSLQLDLVNAMVVLSSLRLVQRRRSHVCFVLWRMGIARRTGLDAIAQKFNMRLHRNEKRKCFLIWRHSVAIRKHHHRLAKVVVTKMMGRGLLYSCWLVWKQLMSDTRRKNNISLAKQELSLRAEVEEASGLLQRAREEMRHERERADAEEKRAESSEASRLRSTLGKAERRIEKLEAALDSLRSAGDDTSTAHVAESARSLSSRCALVRSQLSLVASVHTPDPRALLTQDELAITAAAGCSDGCAAVHALHPAQILTRFTNHCREISRGVLERTGAGKSMTAEAFDNAMEFLGATVPDLAHANQRHLAAVLESVGLGGQDVEMNWEAKRASRSLLQQQAVSGGGKVELPEDMCEAAKAAQELVEAVEADAQWPPGIISAEDLAEGEPGAIGILLCHLFTNFPGERAMRGAWQDETSLACARADALEEQLALANASEDSTATKVTAATVAGWNEEVVALEAAAAVGTREQGLARHAFVDAARTVGVLEVQLLEARHGTSTVGVMVNSKPPP